MGFHAPGRAETGNEISLDLCHRYAAGRGVARLTVVFVFQREKDYLSHRWRRLRRALELENELKGQTADMTDKEIVQDLLQRVPDNASLQEIARARVYRWGATGFG